MCVSPSRSPKLSTGSKAERTCILEFRSLSGFGKLQGSGTAGASPHLHFVLLATGAKQGLPLVLRLGVTCSQALACSSLLPHPQSITRTKTRESLWAPPCWQNNNFIRSGGRGHRQERRSQGRKGALPERGADSSPRPPRPAPPRARPLCGLSCLE